MVERPYRQERKIVNLVTQETRFYIIQYILAHPDNLPSLDELDFAIPKSKSTIREHIDILIENDLIDKYSSEERSRDLPSTFFGLTNYGIKTLDDMSLLQGKTILQKTYSKIEKPARIQKYENAPRPNKRPSESDTSSSGISSEYLGSTPQLVKSALKLDEIEKGETIEQTGKSTKQGEATPRVVAIGCGGAGNNTINRIHNIGVEGLRTVAINTDKNHLEMVEADEKLLIGEETTNGLGAGGSVEIAKEAAKNAESKINEILGDEELVFVIGGMGGGTGTGVIPIVSEMAHDRGSVVIGIASLPFNVEKARQAKAQQGIEELIGVTDSVIVLDNNNLIEKVPNLPIGKAFSVMDQIIAETLKGLVETITTPSLINLDFADVMTVFQDGDISVVSVGEASNKEESLGVVQRSMESPLLDVDIGNASSGLVHITGGPDLALKDAEKRVQNIAESMGNHTSIIWGARVTEEFKGQLRVMSIFSGYDYSDVLPRFAEDTGNESSLRDLDLSKGQAGDLIDTTA